MGLLSMFVNDKPTDVVNAVGNALDNLFTSDEERLDKANVRTRLMASSDKIQAAINQEEARHRSLFIAGWRPCIGWICALAFFWHYIGYNLMQWLAAINKWTQPPELVGSQELTNVLFGILGLAAYRTFEKIKGISK